MTRGMKSWEPRSSVSPLPAASIALTSLSWPRKGRCGSPRTPCRANALAVAYGRHTRRTSAAHSHVAATAARAAATSPTPPPPPPMAMPGVRDMNARGAGLKLNAGDTKRGGCSVPTETNNHSATPSRAGNVDRD